MMAGSGERVASKGYYRVRAIAKGCNSPSVQVRAVNNHDALVEALRAMADRWDATQCTRVWVPRNNEQQELVS